MKQFFRVQGLLFEKKGVQLHAVRFHLAHKFLQKSEQVISNSSVERIIGRPRNWARYFVYKLVITIYILNDLFSKDNAV